MAKKTKIGIIICDRYSDCGGGKCMRSLNNREGAFDIYGADEELELVGYTTCGGCPGGNIESVPEEMAKNGAEVIHLATGFLVGYPPCPYTDHFKSFIQEKFGLKVVLGTHPIPEKYVITHSALGTWDDPEWKERLKDAMRDKELRIAYN
ncbi:MAG: CGGC domain-containing protein [Bacteroidales bacterium]|nr:CGGC domain-containing protein [Bacteroidales bacterium]